MAVINMMKFLTRSSKVLILLTLIVATSCETVIIKPNPTLKPTITNLLELTPTPESTLTATLTETRQIKPTVTYAASPTLFGTPLPDYKTIPIPEDAVGGMEVGSRYQFTSKQAPIDVSNYYQQVLPQLDWEIQQISILEGDTESPTNICIALSQIVGPFQGLICITRTLGEELTNVRISVYNTN